MEVHIKESLPNVDDIIVHIEPRGKELGLYPDALQGKDVYAIAKQVVESELTVGKCHLMQLRQYESGWAVSMHCTLPGEIPLPEAHRISTRLEGSLRQALPDLDWVVIHTEPEIGS
jgi:divalent metal cation (Fe/Co/Zn/Cd) transporter